MNLVGESTIPKNILFFWHDKATLPGPLADAMKETMRRNADYRAICFDDNDIKKFLRSRNRLALLKLYNLVRIPASRSDIARLLMLHEFGGVYLDVSMEIHGSLDELCGYQTDLVLVRRDDRPEFETDPEAAWVINGILAARSGLEFLDLCIERISRHLLAGSLNTKCWHATGPGVINETLKRCNLRQSVTILSFKEMLEGYVLRRRVKGVNNAWVQLQRNGIVDPGLYTNGPLDLNSDSTEWINRWDYEAN